MTPGSHLWRISPARVVEGGRLTIETADPGDEPRRRRRPEAPVQFATDPIPAIRVGGTAARVVAASPHRVSIIVPPEAEGGRQAITAEGLSEALGYVEVGARLATGLHQVDSPVFDDDGNVYATYSGTRGQRVPVSIFRLRPDGAREALVTGVVNATSLAFNPYHELCVSSRFDGTVYRVEPDGSLQKVASELGVACGLAFAEDGTMFVGDRSGTLFKINAAGHVIPFATLPPSIAAFHITLGPDEAVYLTGPTLSTRDVVYRVDRRGEISVFAEGFGRPQGLAFDGSGTLHVAEAAAGRSGIYRVTPGGRELMVAGAGLIGLAFHPEHGVALSSNDAVYRFGNWS